jgi:organic radical activating enzyme
VLNTGHRLSFDQLLLSLVVLRLAGLRSVILIGGGEPTLHPRFGDVVKAIKLLGLQCAVVTNGSGNDRIQRVAHWLTTGDWIRLSLDAGRESTFHEMHLPRHKNTRLRHICQSAMSIKKTNSAVSLGFSFIVCWGGATVNGNPILENISEMAVAAQLAKHFRFDFITFKPLLDRDEVGAETIQVDKDGGAVGQSWATLAERVAEQLTRAKALEDDQFRVYSSPNLVALRDRYSLDQSRIQPERCHMRLFRQVVTPTGVYGCPVYRGNSKDQIGPSLAYIGIEQFLRARRRSADLTRSFNAAVECREISCLYNATNWWLQDIYDGRSEPAVHSVAQDFFL